MADSDRPTPPVSGQGGAGDGGAVERSAQRSDDRSDDETEVIDWLAVMGNPTPPTASTPAADGSA
ncbi:MAG: hypothetical protein ACR2QK_20145, partial [Acidimicrobiales bacterium]